MDFWFNTLIVVPGKSFMPLCACTFVWMPSRYQSCSLFPAGLKECMTRGYSYIDGVEELLSSLKANNYEMHAFTNYPIWSDDNTLGKPSRVGNWLMIFGDFPYVGAIWWRTNWKSQDICLGHFVPSRMVWKLLSIDVILYCYLSKMLNHIIPIRIHFPITQ